MQAKLSSLGSASQVQEFPSSVWDRKRRIDVTNFVRSLSQYSKTVTGRLNKVTSVSYKFPHTLFFQLQARRDEELSLIHRELVFLQSNLLKEQKRLRELVEDKERTIQRQEAEIRKFAGSKKRLVIHDDTTTATSSEDSSPKSSFSKAPKVEVRQRTTAGDPPPPPPRLLVNHHHQQQQQQQQQQSSAEQSPNKPPVPSRAGVNRKLNKAPPPPPPVRNSDLTKIISTSFDSGREESDGFATDSSSNVVSSKDEGFSSSHEALSQEGEQSSSPPPPQPPPRTSSSSSSSSSGDQQQHVTIRQLSNHRTMQKPSDIKHRSKLRSNTIPPSVNVVTRLGVLREHQVVTTDGENGEKTTVTYWTEPYL